jgi:NADH-quinone oxidoreductase subunit N
VSELQHYDWGAVAPLLVLAFGAILVLLLEVGISRSALGGDAASRARRERRLGLILGMVASGALIATMALAFASLSSGQPDAFDSLRPTLRLDGLASVAIGLVGLGALLCVWLSSTYLIALRINHGEYYALMLLSICGIGVAVSAESLMLLFIGLELMNNPIYALVAFDRARSRGSEAGVKYFLLGAFASAILLFGIALLYGATGRLDYEGLRETISPASPLAMLGVAMILAGVAFKIALVPFHQWAPDVYEGAPTPITAFLSVSVKAAAIFLLVRLVTGPLPELTELMRPVFWALAAASIVVGNLMAIVQKNVKRMLAYSGIAHAGYMMIAFVTGSPEAYAALAFYLLVYAFFNVGAFGVIIALTSGGRAYEQIDDFAGLAGQRPALAAAMTLFMLALIGIPGTAGFFGKFHLFAAAIGGGEIGLVVLAVLGSAASVFYYLRVPVAMYMREVPRLASGEPASNELVVLCVCAAATLYLGFFPNPELPGVSLSLLDALRVAWPLR